MDTVTQTALYAVLVIILFLVVFVLILKIVYKATFRQNQALGTPIDTQHLQIRFLQMNLFWRPTVLHLFRKEYRDERAGILSSSLDDFDICCFNEAFQFGSSTVTDFISRCEEKGFAYHLAQSSNSFFSRHFIDGGLLIISKLPIITSDSIIYKAGCGCDEFSAKGALYARVSSGSDSFIHVFGTHLQASYGIPTASELSTRASQLSELVAFIKKNASDKSPVFLLGDFNTNSRDGDEYHNMMAALGSADRVCEDSLFEALGEHPITYGDSENGKPKDTVLTVKEDFNSAQSIDYIFFMQKDGAPWRVQTHSTSVEKFTVDNHMYGQLSDHYGIRSAVTLEAGGSM